ncbi:hypothetical protein MKW98_021931 [Papaver atlanticum]|uniref:Uncharacterized protein n=1 Tax=Papaver atlanticum TaxID=357466 RepID=A0AAD4XYX4_9MAGN|nr:hypothetical protein MKW98_021931 [Papaver atlanticum]
MNLLVLSEVQCYGGLQIYKIRRIHVTDKDRSHESEENLMDLYQRCFQTFKEKVMNINLERHCILGIFTDTSKEEYPIWLGCKLPSLEAERKPESISLIIRKTENLDISGDTFVQLRRQPWGRNC